MDTLFLSALISGIVFIFSAVLLSLSYSDEQVEMFENGERDELEKSRTVYQIIVLNVGAFAVAYTCTATGMGLFILAFKYITGL